MARTLFRRWVGGLMLLLAWPLTLFANPADGYPNKPLRVIIPFAPGGASDFVGRILVQKLGDQLGQQVIIENRTGAAGNIGMEAAAKAVPDGYTLYLGNIGTLAINPAIFPTLPIKPLQDFAPITLIADVPSALVVNTEWGPRQLGDALTLLKSKPGQFNFATPGSGSLNRLKMELLMKSAGVSMVHVPYKGGGGPAAMGLISGETQLMFNTMPSVKNFVTVGRMHALAVTSAQRMQQLPDVPTMAELGYPDLVTGSWQGMLVPAKTPKEIVAKLHRALNTVLDMPDVRERLAAGGVFPAQSKSPEEFGQFLASESQKWGKVARDARATAD
ncbi:MAG: tripartite tricarboxylate transporter substrate binding protein [Alphaproteobacteria bacterium]|nr:tripartite tricarboxylate transporter substrate binding protein [Alphaproteobacteria bacterium]